MFKVSDRLPDAKLYAVTAFNCYTTCVGPVVGELCENSFWPVLPSSPDLRSCVARAGLPRIDNAGFAAYLKRRSRYVQTA
jgi:hypothetical protein